MCRIITKSQTRNWTMCSILSATLLLAPFANADTTKTFTVKQTTANNANDLFVNFNNLGLVPMSNIIHDANGMTVGLFKTAAVTPPGSGSILYTNPVNNMGNPLAIRRTTGYLHRPIQGHRRYNERFQTSRRQRLFHGQWGQHPQQRAGGLRKRRPDAESRYLLGVPQLRK